MNTSRRMYGRILTGGGGDGCWCSFSSSSWTAAAGDRTEREAGATRFGKSESSMLQDNESGFCSTLTISFWEVATKSSGHMFFIEEIEKKPMQAIFAYLMATYVLAFMYYLVASRCIGTPFNDSLTTEQQTIKALAVQQRKSIFYTGVGIGAAALAIFQPF